MLNTELLGDPAACRETGEWMKQISASVFDTATTLEGVRLRVREFWRGDAADAFTEHVGQGGREADQLSMAIERAGFAMLDLADKLDAVAAQLQQARTIAAEAGLTVTGQGIEPPSGVTRAAGHTTPQQATATENDTARIRTWHELRRSIGHARGVELGAHKLLAAATSTPKTIFEDLCTNPGFIATGATAGVADGSPEQHSRYRMLAHRYARESSEQLSDVGAE